jgi:hypothetical protein
LIVTFSLKPLPQSSVFVAVTVQAADGVDAVAVVVVDGAELGDADAVGELVELDPASLSTVIE